MKYHALFVIFEKEAKYCRLLQIIGGALRVNRIYSHLYTTPGEGTQAK